MNEWPAEDQGVTLKEFHRVLALLAGVELDETFFDKVFEYAVRMLLGDLYEEDWEPPK